MNYESKICVLENEQIVNIVSYQSEKQFWVFYLFNFKGLLNFKAKNNN